MLQSRPSASIAWPARGVLLLGCTLLLGCVMPDEISRTQKELADVRQELREIQRDHERALSKLESIEDRGRGDDDAVTRADLAEFSVQIERIERETTRTGERVNDLDQRFDHLAQQAELAMSLARRSPGADLSAGVPQRPDRIGDDPSGAGGAGPFGAAPTGTDSGPTPPSRPRSADGTLPDPEALYNTAYTDFSKGNYELAVSGFQEYEQLFPDSTVADNALYWVGECYFSQGRYDDALGAFDRLLESYPRSDKTSASHLKKALAHLENNDIGKAIVQLRFVDATYPGSDEAKIARDKLSSLGASL